MTEANSDHVPSRRGPRGRTAYLRLLERLPPGKQERLRSAATALRRSKTAVRLFRERWVRRARRSIGRTQRSSLRALRRLERSVSYTRQRLRDTGRGRRENELDPTSPQAPIVHRTRSALSRRLFPPTVPLPGTGDVVLVNAVGRPIGDVLASAHAFGDRWIVATDDPDVGALRAADITYEYLPADFEGGLAARTHWFDYVYGIDSIVDIDELRVGRTSRPESIEPFS